jgi:hypothetical protein
MSTPDRRALLDRNHPALSIRGQCRLLGLARSGVTGALADNAVDMTLRLDDAAASPTCPPRQQQQTTCVA